MRYWRHCVWKDVVDGVFGDGPDPTRCAFASTCSVKLVSIIFAFRAVAAPLIVVIVSEMVCVRASRRWYEVTTLEMCEAFAFPAENAALATDMLCCCLDWIAARETVSIAHRVVCQVLTLIGHMSAKAGYFVRRWCEARHFDVGHVDVCREMRCGRLC